jgi:hypothetical protein
MSLQSVTGVLGVFGFVISVYNLVSAMRSRTVNPQPVLLAELRGYLDVAQHACSQMRLRLNFDRHQIITGPKPEIPPRPSEFDDAINRMPELGFTITSIGQKQIALLHALIQGANYNWKTVQDCLDAEPMNLNVMDFAQRLKRQCSIIEKFFPTYVDAVTSINKGNLWKRFKYRDHHPLTYKITKWTPLQQAVSGYERSIMESL